VLPIARDRLDDIRARVEEAASADVVLSTGGVSVGEFDFVRDALDAIGVQRKFWKVAQKPGKPLTFGTLGRRLFFGLAGQSGVGARVLRGVRPAGAAEARRARGDPPSDRAGAARDRRAEGDEPDRVRARPPEARRRRLVRDAVRGAGLGRALVAHGRRGLLVGPAQETTLAEGDVYPVLVLDAATFDGRAVVLSS
jgi:molybdopterin molybdotransferase